MDHLIQVVILPIIKAACELCEKNGLSFVCHIEHKDGTIWSSVTHHLQKDVSAEMINTLAAAEGKLVPNKEEKE